MAKRRRRRRARRNPSAIASVAIVGGVGVIGYFLWQHYQRSQKVPAYAPPPPQTKASGGGFLDLLIGTGANLLSAKAASDQAAKDAKTKAEFQANLNKLAAAGARMSATSGLGDVGGIFEKRGGSLA